MKKTKTQTRRGLPLLLAALCLCGAASAQPTKKFEPTRAQATDAAQGTSAGRLRRGLVAAVGADFEVVRGRLTRRSIRNGGGLYWVAHLRARRPGEFSVAYTYRARAEPKDPTRASSEHETFVRVGPVGCGRRPRYNFVCVGDTLILSFLVNDYQAHTFRLARRPFAPADESAEAAARDAQDAALYAEPVPNPAAGFLKYVGRRAVYAALRAPGHTLGFEATFEAVRPGSFNLLVTTDADAAGKAARHSVPVLIVERGTPIVVPSAGENVRDYGGSFASRAGNYYASTPILLQPGDRLTVSYFGRDGRGWLSGERLRAAEASVRDYPPVVTLLPFGVDTSLGYEEWLGQPLPPPRFE
jgi:hypothetical protein